jgi:hypothetical protein
MRRVGLAYAVMKLPLSCASFLFLAATAGAQIQVDLKFKRLQYIAYEPVMATVAITNLAGRDVDLRDTDGQAWFGFEVTGKEGQPVVPFAAENTQPSVKIQGGQKLTQRINLTSLYSVHDFGTYHIRAHIYFADLGKFFYSATKVFEVTEARPIWQKTVGIPDGGGEPGASRTYSLMSNRFADHTSLYVRVEDKESGVVYATYSLGRTVAFDDPQAEIDQTNQLHVLHCYAPRSWAYSRIGLNGELLAHSSFMEAKSRPRLFHGGDGTVAVRGGILERPALGPTHNNVPKLSERPEEMPKGD